MKNLKNYLPIIVFVITLILSGVTVLTSRELEKRKNVTPTPSLAVLSGSQTVCGVTLGPPSSDPSSVNGIYTLAVPLKNNTQNSVTVTTREDRSYCSSINVTSCNDHYASNYGSYTLAAGETKTITVVDDNTTGNDCGAFQVDLVIGSVNGDQSCNTNDIPHLVWGFYKNLNSCTIITSTPTPTVTTSPTPTISVSPTITPTTTLTSTPTVTLTGTLTPTATPTISTSPTPTPTGVTYNHNVCVDRACVSQLCSPANQPCNSTCSGEVDCNSRLVCVNNACKRVVGSGSDECQSDVNCQGAPVTPKVPTSATTTPTILSIIGGAALLLGGILLAL